MYGFHKKPCLLNDDLLEFFHEYFIRNRQDLLVQIKRKSLPKETQPNLLQEFEIIKQKQLEISKDLTQSRFLLFNLDWK